MIKKLEQEIKDYTHGNVEISEGVQFNQHKLIKRIYLFRNKKYSEGKLTSQGKYKYWYDIITPRLNDEVKNLRIDTKNFMVFSENPTKDFPAVFIMNGAMNEYLWETDKAEELNDVVETFCGDGNVIFKRVSGGYEVCDPTNIFITNIRAKTINETAVIERHEISQSELRKKSGIYENVERVIEECGKKEKSATNESMKKLTTTPYYEIFERNGEVSEKEFNEIKGIEGGDEDTYFLAKIIIARGNSTFNKDHILYAEKIEEEMSDIYITAHRGKYNGRFWREGVFELLFDYQVRANEIGNQIARGLEFASKTIYRSADQRTIQNVMTDMDSGDVIQSADLSQVEVRMQAMDQLIADWNRNIEEADRIANSYEIIQGKVPSGTPFRLGQLLDTNASKTYVLLRQKLGISFKKIFRRWVFPEMVKHLKGKDIIRITGDTAYLEKFREMIAKNWYARNLINMEPHTTDIKKALLEAKMQDLKEKDPVLKNNEKIWEDVLPRLQLTITGENMDSAEEIETLTTFIQLETEPIRRGELMDIAYKAKGYDITPMEEIMQQQEQQQSEMERLLAQQQGHEQPDERGATQPL